MRSFMGILSLVLLSACGSGGNGSGAGNLSHEELASQFVSRLNSSGRYDVNLVKTNTLQYDFIVIYDRDFDEYIAVDLDGYGKNSDAAAYFASNSHRFYYDLDVLPSYYYTTISYQYNSACECSLPYTQYIYVPVRYLDTYSGIVFEQTQNTPKDRLKLAALKEGLEVRAASQKLIAQFGMSQERSLEVAKLALIWQKTPKDRMTDQDHDRFAREILGHSISEYKKAIELKARGESSLYNKMISETAQFNGINVDQINGVIAGIIQE